MWLFLWSLSEQHTFGSRPKDGLFAGLAEWVPLISVSRDQHPRTDGTFLSLVKECECVAACDRRCPS